MPEPVTIHSLYSQREKLNLMQSKDFAEKNKKRTQPTLVFYTKGIHLFLLHPRYFLTLTSFMALRWPGNNELI